MIHRVESAACERQRGAVRYRNPNGVAKAVGLGLLHRRLQTVKRNIGEDHGAARRHGEMKPGPAGTGADVEKQFSRAEPQQLGDPPCPVTRRPARCAVVADASPALDLEPERRMGKLALSHEALHRGRLVGVGRHRNQTRCQAQARNTSSSRNWLSSPRRWATQADSILLELLV